MIQHMHMCNCLGTVDHAATAAWGCSTVYECHSSSMLTLARQSHMQTTKKRPQQVQQSPPKCVT